MFKDGLCNLEKCAQHPQVIKALHKVLILVLMQFPRSCCGGPCEHTAYNMSAATASDKKAFEATVSPMVNMRMIPKCHALQFLCQCHVEWPETSGECLHDYGIECPFGWYKSGHECLAPVSYDVCSKRKAFWDVSPAAKADWARNCKVQWPCRERNTCRKVYSAPCPADWYAFNGGKSCAAQSTYAGTCAPVLHGLLDLTLDEKAEMEAKCAFDWPCTGEVYEAVLQVAGEAVELRMTANLAENSKEGRSSRIIARH